MTGSDLTLMGGSPFDAIRREDERGEYWSARDLMPLLGYDHYENFTRAIDRARFAAWNSEGESAAQRHFRDATKMVPIGSGAHRQIGDRHLTRFACYLVAMNGDPRKEEIARAQTYFAIKTREAEMRLPAHAWTLPTTFPEALELAARQAREIEAEKARVAELEPAAHSWETLAEATGDYSLREAAQILDRDPSISTGQNRLARYLRDAGWTDSDGQPYQRHVDAGRLVRRPRSYDHPTTGQPVATTQVRITVRGLHALHKALGGSGPVLLEVAS